MGYRISIVAIIAMIVSANVLYGAAGDSPAVLPTEEGAWTHAPNVPPPIRRTEPSLVVVHWEATETKIELTPNMV